MDRIWGEKDFKEKKGKNHESQKQIAMKRLPMTDEPI